MRPPATALVAIFGTALACGSAAPPPGASRSTWTTLRVEHDGRARTVCAQLPRGAGAQPPLLIVLHGRFSSGRGIARDTGWPAVAARHGAVALYPNGVGLLGLFRHWNAEFCCGPAAKRGIDDIGLIRRLIEEAPERLRVDPSAVFVYGHSNGGMLAHRFAARHPDLVDGIATTGAVAGATWVEPVYPPPADSPVPVVMVHGRQDHAVPFDGGRPFGVGPAGTARYWAESNGCGDAPRLASERDGAVARRTWCAGTDHPISLLALAGWGHDVPSPRFTERLPEEDPLRGFDGAAEMWRLLTDRP